MSFPTPVIQKITHLWYMMVSPCLSVLPVCLPAVGLAVGLDPEGYGNPDFCWISIYDKLIWSFAGPIAIVILVTVCLSDAELQSLLDVQHNLQ